MTARAARPHPLKASGSVHPAPPLSLCLSTLAHLHAWSQSEFDLPKILPSGSTYGGFTVSQKVTGGREAAVVVVAVASLTSFGTHPYIAIKHLILNLPGKVFSFSCFYVCILYKFTVRISDVLSQFLVVKGYFWTSFQTHLAPVPLFPIRSMP